MKKLMLSVFALAAFGFSANAQNTATALDVSADAELVTAISITNNVGLQFGQVSISGVDGDVTLTADADPAPVSSGGVQHLNSVTQTAAKFTVDGQDGLSFDIDCDATATLTDAVSSGTLTVTLEPSSTTGTIGTTSDVFYVGGVLNVLAANLAGAYAGSFDVTVSYN